MNKRNKIKKKEVPPAMPKANFIVLGLAVIFFLIGVQQSLKVGFELSYWIFMLSICMLLLHRYLLQNKSKPDQS